MVVAVAVAVAARVVISGWLISKYPVDTGPVRMRNWSSFMIRCATEVQTMSSIRSDTKVLQYSTVWTSNIQYCRRCARRAQVRSLESDKSTLEERLQESETRCAALASNQRESDDQAPRSRPRYKRHQIVGIVCTPHAAVSRASCGFQVRKDADSFAEDRLRGLAGLIIDGTKPTATDCSVDDETIELNEQSSDRHSSLDRRSSFKQAKLIHTRRSHSQWGVPESDRESDADFGDSEEVPVSDTFIGSPRRLSASLHQLRPRSRRYSLPSRSVRLGATEDAMAENADEIRGSRVSQGHEDIDIAQNKLIEEVRLRSPLIAGAIPPAPAVPASIRNVLEHCQPH